MTNAPVLYQRVLVKLSGEALMGDLDYGIEPEVIQRIAAEVAAVRKLGIEVAIVIGGGNIFRGAGLARAGRHRPPTTTTTTTRSRSSAPIPSSGRPGSRRWT